MHIPFFNHGLCLPVQCNALAFLILLLLLGLLLYIEFKLHLIALFHPNPSTFHPGSNCIKPLYLIGLSIGILLYLI